MKPKRQVGLFIEQVDDEQLVFDSEANATAALNAPAAAVFELCDGTREVDEIVNDLIGTPNPLREDHVRLALSELAEAGIIDYTPDRPTPSRRQILLMLGAAAAASVPVVEAIMAGPVAAASLFRFREPTRAPSPCAAPSPGPPPACAPSPCAAPSPGPGPSPHVPSPGQVRAPHGHDDHDHG